MSYSLEELLGFVALGKTIEKVRVGIPELLPEGFKKVTDYAVKDRGRFYRYYGERRLARLTVYGNEARKGDMKKLDQQDVICLHSFEHLNLDPLLLTQIQSAQAYEVDQALMEVGRQVENFTKKFENLRCASTLQALRLGNIYFDAEGEFLPSSSGAHWTVSFNRNANNENQLNGIVDASWALTTTDIPGQIRNLKKRARKDTGHSIDLAFYGSNIVGYLESNSRVQEYLARDGNLGMRDHYLTTGELPDGLLGIKKWIPVYESFFEDYDGSNQDLWDDDLVVFTPEVSDQWWGMMEGSYMVPRSIDVSPTVEGAFANLEQVYGMFGYSVLEHNPPKVVTLMGDTMLPLLKNAEATYAADVTP